MKRQVRHGVFETNSSSTHSICIPTEHEELSIPDRVEFEFGEFGWEVDKLTSRSEKIKYLYTCLSYVEIDKLKEYLQFIANTLKAHGVNEIYFDSFEYRIYYYHDIELYLNAKDGYVDHGNEAREFVDAVCTDEQRLLNYLFSDKTFILTGNDNDDIDVDINVDYPHEEYYKWN